MIRGLCLLALGTVSAFALDVVGAAPYLDKKYRAEWQSKPLEEVLKEIEGLVGNPLSISTSIVANQTITLIDTEKVNLRDTLLLLERSQNLRFTAEQFTLRVETQQDFRDRKRHPVNISVRDYGLFITVKDLTGPNLGFDLADDSGRMALFIEASSDSITDPELVVALVDDIAQSTGVKFGNNGNLYLQVTDEEEVAIRASLEEIQKIKLTHSHWRTIYGTLPAGELMPTGILTIKESAALTARLQQRESLSVTSLGNQLVNAVRGHQQSITHDLDVIGGQFDPAISVITTGRAMSVRPITTTQFDRLTYRLSWVEPLTAITTILTNPPGVVAGSSSSTVTTTVTKEDKEEKEEEKTIDTTTVDSTLRPGVSFEITQPAFWTWMPQGEVMLPKDHALVLATEHPKGTAIMILEAQP
jgi:hypothetical protein